MILNGIFLSADSNFSISCSDLVIVIVKIEKKKSLRFFKMCHFLFLFNFYFKNVTFDFIQF